MRIALAALCLALMAAAPSARAAISCNASVSNVSSVYDPATNLTLTGSWTVNCTRAGGDPNTYNFALGVNDGLQSPGDRVKHTGLNNYYTYQTYRTATGVWGAPSNLRFNGTVNFGGQLVGSQSGTFEVRVPAQAAGPAGTYMDTLQWTLYSWFLFPAISWPIGSGPFNVVLITNPTCSMSSIPNMTFNYTSFQPGPASASSNFTVTCSDWLPYTMALDNAGPITDNAVNLTYTLSLMPSSSGTGTGLAQSYSVDGTMAGGQSGTCATAFCTNAAATNKTRTLTVTY